MDERSIKRRVKTGDGKTDDQRAQEYMKVVGEKFPQAKNRTLQHLFLDACFDVETEEEEEAFNKVMEDLYILLDRMTGLDTSSVNAEVESAHGKLKRELKNREKDKEEFAKQITDVMDQLKKAEDNRSKDEGKYEEKLKNMEDKMKELEEKGKRRGAGFTSDLVASIMPPTEDVLQGYSQLEKSGSNTTNGVSIW